MSFPPALPDTLPRRLQALPPPWARLCLRVARFVERDLSLSLRGRHILVGFSGGADSTALLLILYYLAPRLRLSLRAAHLDHGLRPCAPKERNACAALCAALDIPCLTERIDVRSLSRQKKTGLEETARRARYAFYAGALRDGDDLLALGHQNNDLAEDILMRLIRGAGWPALGGMPGRDGKRRLIRPLLLTPRAELEAFLTDLGVSWAKDASNLDPAYFRNRVRSTLLPLFLRENPAFLRTAATLWRLARLDEEFFQTLVQAPLARTRLPLLPEEPDAETGEEGATKIRLQTPAQTLSSLPQALRLRLYRSILEDLAPGPSPAANLFALDRAWSEQGEATSHDLALGRIARIREKSILWELKAKRDPRRGFRAAAATENNGQRRRKLTASPAADSADQKACNRRHRVNILIFGPNGSGKGTQGDLLKQKYNLAHIESGAIFREHIARGTELGQKAKAYMDKGDLVPDAITIPMVLETLREKGAHGWLLDGFPRNWEQARQLWDALQAAGMDLDFVVEILLPREAAKKRIMGRRLCATDNNHPNNIHIEAIRPKDDACRVCGGALSSRSDDQNEAAINKRHEIYYDAVQGTLAACRFFRDLAAKGKTRYLELDGEGDIASVRDALLNALR